MSTATKRKRGGEGTPEILGLMDRLYQALKQSSDVDDERECSKQQQRLHKIQQVWAQVNKRFVCVRCQSKHDKDASSENKAWKCDDCFAKDDRDVEESEESECEDEVSKG